MSASTNQDLVLPPAFLLRMKSLLGTDYPAFLAALQCSPTTGLRVNTLKIDPDQFARISPFYLKPVPWCQSGFTFRVSSSQPTPGKHAYHAAGLYYLQEPSAMVVAELLNLKPGELVLDLAAAPGGKATHLAARMENQGLLIANEIHPKRVWELAGNLERWGARNAAITNESPERLAARLGAIFDRVLVDAPCSGEGLFRRKPAARSQWSLDLVRGCAVRQLAILESAASLVKPGGWLVYSTCTFNPDENEGSLAFFLDKHPDFEIVKADANDHFSPGCPYWLDLPASLGLKDSVRLWPHRLDGEGHFIALLHRKGFTVNIPTGKSILRKPPKEVQRALEEFCSRTGLTLKENFQLNQHGSYLYHSPARLPALDGLRLVHPGWWLGIWKKDRFEPSHALSMAISDEDIQRRIDLSLADPAPVYAYLRGESLALEALASYPDGDGWSVITVDGFPLGWVKQVQAIAKNYYPRGLRWT